MIGMRKSALAWSCPSADGLFRLVRHPARDASAVRSGPARVTLAGAAVNAMLSKFKAQMQPPTDRGFGSIVN